MKKNNRAEVLRETLKRLKDIKNNPECYKYTDKDFSAIHAVCMHFEENLMENEVFTNLKNVAEFFRKSKDFTVEMCDFQYHIFIEG